MTKQDILGMKHSDEINHTVFTHPELWDKEIRDHAVAIARQENLKTYGSEDFLPTPPEKKNAAAALPKTDL